LLIFHVQKRASTGTRTVSLQIDRLIVESPTLRKTSWKSTA